MEPKHTPGPWRILEYDNGITGEYRLIGIFPPSVQGLRKQAPIVEKVWGETIEQSDANARLIAAAPEMRQMLADTADWIEAWADKGNQESAAIRVLLARIDGGR